jgi:hypothetical protein
MMEDGVKVMPWSICSDDFLKAGFWEGFLCCCSSGRY